MNIEVYLPLVSDFVFYFVVSFSFLFPLHILRCFRKYHFPRCLACAHSKRTFHIDELARKCLLSRLPYAPPVPPSYT